MQAEGLPGDGRSTHAFARVSVGASVQHTAVVWQSEAPRWDEKLSFKWVAPTAQPAFVRLHRIRLLPISKCPFPRQR